MTTTIHQLVHGYRHGHEQLAASTRLPAKDEELITRLSDLSGSLTDDIQFTSYITAFPLLTKNFYAVARTWPDENAPRAGCVITHTLLIPMAEWTGNSVPQGFSRRLRIRPNLGHLEEYAAPIEFPFEQPNYAPVQHVPKQERTLEFVAKFFGQGLRPLVWFDELHPEDAFWQITTRLWPALRKEFACCTFSLQPRLVEDKAFDLMFAPTSTYRRFHSFPRENLIGASQASGMSAFLASDEGPWCREWERLLFREAADAVQFSDFDDFRDLLGSDPTTIKKIFLIKELRDRIPDSPTAGVGLMDVVASMAPEETDAHKVKSNTTSLALETVASMRDVNSALNCLFLISERLSRKAFKLSVAGFFSRLTSIVASRTVEDPETALKTGESLFVSCESIQQSAFAKGVMEGLAQIAMTAPRRLEILHHSPVAAPHIIVEYPLIAQHYLRGMGSQGLTTRASGDLVSWLSSSVIDSEMRKRVRDILLPHIEREEEAPLLEELLRDVPNEEVSRILETLAGPQCVLKLRRICQVASERLSIPYPSSVQNWARATKSWSPNAASVVAAAFTKDADGLKQLLNDPLLPSDRRAEILGAFIDSLAVDRLPVWLKDSLRVDATLFVPLLALGAETPPALLATIATLLSQVKDIPIALESTLRGRIAVFADFPFGPDLIDHAMRSAIGAFIVGEVDLSACKAWHDTGWGMRWLLDTPSYDLKSLITRPLYNNSNAWERAWVWLAESPVEVFKGIPLTLLEIAEGLISPRFPWTPGAVSPWVKILRRANKESERSVYLRLCAHALQFAFNHPKACVGALVVETFQPVYDCIAISKDAPPQVYSQFGVFGWDKGKELRKDLIYAFMHSEWRPGDLVFAVRDDSLLRKIFKRIMRQYGGEDYVARMLEDLRQREDAISKNLLTGMKHLVDNPNFHEEWD